MSIASIMVSLDLGRSAGDRVRLAADLAGRFEAGLIGIAARTIDTPAPVGDILEAQDAYAEERAALVDDLAEARTIFARSSGSALRTEWRQIEAGPEAFLVRQARGADLVVVGRDPRGDGAGALGAAPGPVLMEVGRPVLVVPPGIDRLAAARIVVAWKDAPEARRAVTAALPFITRADQVFVVGVGREASHEGAGEVADLLARHGAHVTAHALEAPNRTVAGEILHFSERHDADLVVMGGYGHARLREWLLGGVTRDILQDAPLCCLMCH
ncbi:universal stress protein [Methylobacterium sp. SyP6R]|uniref:universal stress protein n=1 Tax=Methylobacterium sp. SyP6R TaxID=2718876 RepID=UPI001F2C76A1|nr:universal stress protein [Methylobacterium sp. SyP6R]MCF4128824.1 universal stress protein [Methylobacterium sp. SyP6R]